MRKSAETLPIVDQWRIVELMAQSLSAHRFLLCHPQKDERDYKLDFVGEGWLDYIPSMRHPIKVLATNEGFEGFATTSIDPAVEPLVVLRKWHSIVLDTFETKLINQVDGNRSISDILRTIFAGKDNKDLLSAARTFFACMADWDHLLFEVP